LKQIVHIFSDEKFREEISQNIKRMAMPKATENIVKDILKEIS